MNRMARSSWKVQENGNIRTEKLESSVASGNGSILKSDYSKPAICHPLSVTRRLCYRTPLILSWAKAEDKRFGRFSRFLFFVLPALNVYSEMPSLPFYRVLQIQINEPLIQESRTQEERAGGLGEYTPSPRK